MGYWMGGIPPVNWWTRKEKSGGQIMAQTTHIFDLARYFFGEVEKVFAVDKKGLMEDVKNYNIEDASSVTLVFNSGLIGTIYSAGFLSCGGKIGMNIYFKDRVIEYDEGIKIVEPNRETKILSLIDAGFFGDTGYKI